MRATDSRARAISSSTPAWNAPLATAPDRTSAVGGGVDAAGQRDIAADCSRTARPPRWPDATTIPSEAAGGRGALQPVRRRVVARARHHVQRVGVARTRRPVGVTHVWHQAVEQDHVALLHL